MLTFEQAWALKTKEGYEYGTDALEQVRFGWEMASKHYRGKLINIRDRLEEVEDRNAFTLCSLLHRARPPVATR